MSYEATYSIQGHDITFYDGKLVCPATANFDDPSYINALKVAATVAPGLDAIQMILNAASMGPQVPFGTTSWYYVGDEELDWIEKQAEIIEGQDFWSAPETVTVFIHLAREEKDRRRVKAVRNAQREERRKRKAPGFVYLIRSEVGYYKIGRTVNPDDRIRTFSVRLPFRVEYEHLIKCEDQRALEKQLHTKFADKRIDGEWFELTPDDVAYIKSLGGAA